MFPDFWTVDGVAALWDARAALSAEQTSEEIAALAAPFRKQVEDAKAEALGVLARRKAARERAAAELLRRKREATNARLAEFEAKLREWGIPSLSAVERVVPLHDALGFNPREPRISRPSGWGDAVAVTVEVYGAAVAKRQQHRVSRVRERDLAEAVFPLVGLRVGEGMEDEFYPSAGSRWGALASAAGYEIAPGVSCDVRVPLPPDHLSQEQVQRAAEAVFAQMNPAVRQARAAKAKQARVGRLEHTQCIGSWQKPNYD